MDETVIMTTTNKPPKVISIMKENARALARWSSARDTSRLHPQWLDKWRDVSLVAKDVCRICPSLRH
ncbi:hypothetical protein NQ318_009534 [Aromia moschata]|uniref:Uncharacterized protein n=1 Tax=Aromia moschata TaxID=1265417 RepID=A0AAV8Y935_9CUCU|nr:hypothetical protein NQ318_009534 [Aromia moschata]